MQKRLQRMVLTRQLVAVGVLVAEKEWGAQLGIQGSTRGRGRAVCCCWSSSCSC
jgi:hypothetical protein